MLADSNPLELQGLHSENTEEQKAPYRKPLSCVHVLLQWAPNSVWRIFLSYGDVAFSKPSAAEISSQGKERGGLLWCLGVSGRPFRAEKKALPTREKTWNNSQPGLHEHIPWSGMRGLRKAHARHALPAKTNWLANSGSQDRVRRMRH
jgi:hypothetical protein